MALYKFITSEDLDIIIREVMLDVVINDNVKLIKRAEKWAIATIKSKISNRYDIALVFANLSAWNIVTNYTADSFVYKEDFYKALINNVGKDPLTNATEWLEDDPRDGLVVRHCCSLVLYFLFKRINPRKVPNSIIDLYEDAMEWLNNVNDSTENPDLPVIENGASTIQWGSNAKLDHYY